MIGGQTAFPIMRYAARRRAASLTKLGGGGKAVPSSARGPLRGSAGGSVESAGGSVESAGGSVNASGKAMIRRHSRTVRSRGRRGAVWGRS